MRTRIASTAAALMATAFAISTPSLGHAPPLTAEEIVHGSHYVVVATVADRTVARSGAAGLIVTRYRLMVEDALRGNPPRELTVEVVGGTLDGETHSSCVTVHLDVGARYVLFVNDPERPGFSTFTGAHQGVLLERPATAGGESTVGPATGAFGAISGKGPVPFREFVERLRGFIAQVEASPAPALREPVQHDPPLPAKSRGTRAGGAELAGSPALPVAQPQAPGPVSPAVPDVVTLDASFGREIPPNPERLQEYSYSRAPARYIVWNQLPSSLTPWSPHDQIMMVRWNSYGDIHRVSGSPTGTWNWGDNIYDITGFPSDQDMQDEFGRSWDTDELAVCFTRWFGSGPIVEADISVNPAFGWTLDNELGTRDNASQWSYDQTLLHELGHSWGLAHPWEVQDVWWDSVMNYAPKRYRFPNLFADDTTAIRTAYPGISVHDGLISFYHTEDSSMSWNATYFEVYPSSRYIRQGDTFQLGDEFKVENIGTDNIVNPRVDVYVTHNRMSWSAYEYLQSLNYTLTMPTYSTYTLSSGSIYVPTSTPPGDYYLALWLSDSSDPYTYNNEAWNIEEYGRITIESYPWTISPASYWQYQEARTGPNGSYDFYFYAYPGQRIDISTCTEDGGDATFDSILELYDPYGAQAAYSDDYCGLRSRISYLVQVEGQHHVVLRGWSGAFGTFRMQYRDRQWAGNNLVLHMAAVRELGVVHLGWSEDRGSYDVQRATTPDFSDGVFLSTGQPGTVFDDPVLTDGVNYFYRVR